VGGERKRSHLGSIKGSPSPLRRNLGVHRARSQTRTGQLRSRRGIKNTDWGKQQTRKGGDEENQKKN